MTACCLVKSLHRTGDGSGGHVHEAAGVVCVFTFLFTPFFWYMLQTLDCGAFISLLSVGCWFLVKLLLLFLWPLLLGPPLATSPEL